MDVLLYPSARETRYAPIAQLDRVTDYESVGRGFESLSAYQKYQIPFQVSGIFIYVDGDSNHLMRMSSGHSLAASWMAATHYLATKAQGQRVPFGVPLKADTFSGICF